MRIDPWTQALLATPVEILGRRLLPFSIGHAYILRKLDNTYAVRGKETRSDLLTAIYICSQTFEENKAWFRDSAVAGPLFQNSQKWAKTFHGRNLLPVDEAFCTYLSDYMSVPDHYIMEAGEGGKPKQCKAPWEFHLVRVLCAGYHVPLKEAWDFPLALARCYFDVWNESQGDDSLVSEEEQELYERYCS